MGVGGAFNYCFTKAEIQTIEKSCNKNNLKKRSFDHNFRHSSQPSTLKTSKQERKHLQQFA